jgi:superfamily II DNA or RNA helicase
MINSLDDITPGSQIAGIIPDSTVTVIAVERHGSTSATITFRPANGKPDDTLITEADLPRLSKVSARRWTFDADAEMFRLASEARRMKHAHLSDPFAAVDTAAISPYPHQIEAVYERLLEQRPIRFLLADDPGAGKTIMSGLLIRELMLRGDLQRCLVVAPGSLVEQWQDELWEKFQLNFEIMSRRGIEESRTGNPFLEKNLLIARVHQLSRADDLIEKIKVSEWDLIIIDESHKMSAHLYGDTLRKTKLFELGEVLRERTRHFLMLTATPHNGKNEDFLAFLSLIDPEQFAGRVRNGQVPDTSNVMRRLIKEDMYKFDGTRIFPPRTSTTAEFELSPAERQLYDAVTSYVKDGMNRADELAESGDKRRGIIVGFALAGLQRRLASSPEAIYQSLRRRHDRLVDQRDELRRLAATGATINVIDLPKGINYRDLEDFDFDEYDDEELENLELTIDSATAALTADELDLEIGELAQLVTLASNVRASRTDTKWLRLRDLLRSPELNDPATSRKLIVFTEHKDTLTYVADRIRDELGKDEAVVVIHGGIKRHDRRDIQDRFRVHPDVRVLVATDAAGEGVNLQTANLMVNYDLPWNPNRIEQRFGRIHRIGQNLPCHLWNMLAVDTREGDVFDKLFKKIEEQRTHFKDQVYDVLGDRLINTSLQDLLIRAIREDEDAVRDRIMDEVINHTIGDHLTELLEERALVTELGQRTSNESIRDKMEQAQARRLHPWFVDTFFKAALNHYGGRITKREPDRYEITRIPATIRSHADPSAGPVQDRYHRVTFDKRAIQPEGLDRAELVTPGTPLLTAVIDTVLDDYGDTLNHGATLIDPNPDNTTPRLLLYINHSITDGRTTNGRRNVISQRFEYVEIDPDGNITNPGPEPYLGYAAATPEQHAHIIQHLNLDWADSTAETTARSWAIDKLAAGHHTTIADITHERVERTRQLVKERLESEIRYWDQRTEELKAQELAGKKPKISSGRARARADEFEARLARRRAELDLEATVQNNPPTVIGAALIVPQTLLDTLGTGTTPVSTTGDTKETDRRAVAAVMAAERALGRHPTEMDHNNPGFDIDSVDPVTGIHYFIEVKGHLPQTSEIHVSAQQVQKAKSNPERWRLAIASVPLDPNQQPVVRYVTEPFKDTELNFAQPYVPLSISKILATAGDPQ